MLVLHGYRSWLQESQKLVFATFEVKVDALTVLTINKTDIDTLINASTATPFISVIAFRS